MKKAIKLNRFTRKEVAHKFATILRNWLTEEQMKEVVRLNRTPEYQDGSCASHNFCDANQAFIDAVTEVLGCELSVANQKHTNFINAAWTEAREANFYLNVF